MTRGVFGRSVSPNGRSEKEQKPKSRRNFRSPLRLGRSVERKKVEPESPTQPEWESTSEAKKKKPLDLSALGDFLRETTAFHQRSDSQWSSLSRISLGAQPDARGSAFVMATEQNDTETTPRNYKAGHSKDSSENTVPDEIVKKVAFAENSSDIPSNPRPKTWRGPAVDVHIVDGQDGDEGGDGESDGTSSTANSTDNEEKQDDGKSVENALRDALSKKVEICKEQQNEIEFLREEMARLNAAYMKREASLQSELLKKDQTVQGLANALAEVIRLQAASAPTPGAGKGSTIPAANAILASLASSGSAMPKSVATRQTTCKANQPSSTTITRGRSPATATRARLETRGTSKGRS